MTALGLGRAQRLWMTKVSRTSVLLQSRRLCQLFPSLREQLTQQLKRLLPQMLPLPLPSWRRGPTTA